MAYLYFVTHPDVIIDPQIPIPEWHLSEVGVRRMKMMLQQPWVASIDAIYSSRENKAMDGASIVADHLGKSFERVEELGEIDRSSTGFIGDEFWQVVEEFFGQPEQSARGWERAVDAQQRIVQVVAKIIKDHSEENILIVSHGAVAALLRAQTKKEPISMDHEQPATNGGNYFILDTEKMMLIQDWQSIETID